MPERSEVFTRAQLVEYLRQAGRPVSMEELVEAFNVKPSSIQTAAQRVSGRVSKAINSGAPITRVGMGVYQFTGASDAWKEVARDGATVILRHVDGKLYVARPITDSTDLSSKEK